jgi:cytochrome P450
MSSMPLEKPELAREASSKKYTVSGPKGMPILGVLSDTLRDPLGFLLRNALQYGDIIPCHALGKKLVQINHPDLIRHVLIDNHKNYYKSASYHRYEPALGQSLLVSNGEKWRHDRQTIQPIFKREKIEGYYFEVVNEVGEKYKKRWLTLTEKESAVIDISSEMADITIEIILRLIFGKSNLDQNTVASLHHAFNVSIDYHKKLRLLPKVHMRKLLQTPGYLKFKKEYDYVTSFLEDMTERYNRGEFSDKDSLLALLNEAHKENPEQFTARDVRDHSIGMVFAGFETTSILMQWMWYALDSRPDIEEKLRAELSDLAQASDYAPIGKIVYLDAVIKETMRLYPPFWALARMPIEDDYLGDYKIEHGTEVLLPQMVMHRDSRWWDDPNAFVPERFFPGNEEKIHPGLYFPFSHGLRKCIGYRLAEMEAKTIFAKLLPIFKVRILNATGNSLFASIALKPRHALLAEISRI